MKHTKQFLLSLIISFLLLFIVEFSYSQDRVCFSVEDSKRLVVEIEKGRLLEKNIVLIEKSNEELIKQTELLKEQVNLLNDKFEAAEKLKDKNEEIYKQKEKVLNDELTEAKKPRWGSLFAAGGIGSIATLVLLLVLSL